MTCLLSRSHSLDVCVCVCVCRCACYILIPLLLFIYFPCLWQAGFKQYSLALPQVQGHLSVRWANQTAPCSLARPRLPHQPLSLLRSVRPVRPLSPPLPQPTLPASSVEEYRLSSVRDVRKMTWVGSKKIGRGVNCAHWV